MIISKKFDCIFEDFDEIVVALAKEVENGWHISEIESHGMTMCRDIRRTEPEFSITLTRKHNYQEVKS